MRLWLITRTDMVDYDEHDSAVIRADSEADARRIAGEELRPFKTWRRADVVTCVPLDDEGPSGIVVASFNAG